jgi:hypothetical protein
MAKYYSCFDVRLRSQIALGELSAADDPADTRPIVDIRLSALPATLPGAPDPIYGLQVAGEDALLSVDGIARFLVRGGREILVDPFEGAAERMVRLFLLGSALGILCHQRGLLPLHANAIAVNGGACAFAGPSGAGKSTLATYFARAGFEVLSDDVCVVGFGNDGSPITWPGLPRVKLWGDAATAFHIDVGGLDRAIEGMDKFHVPLAAPRRIGPMPFRRLYLLDRSEAGAPGEIVRLRGSNVLQALMAQTYRGIYLEPMNLTAQRFRQAAALASRIEVYSAKRAWGYEMYDQEAARLAAHVSQAADGENKQRLHHG